MNASRRTVALSSLAILFASGLFAGIDSAEDAGLADGEHVCGSGGANPEDGELLHQTIGGAAHGIDRDLQRFLIRRALASRAGGFDAAGLGQGLNLRAGIKNQDDANAQGTERREIFDSSPLARVWVFSRRLTMKRGGFEGGETGGMLAFAWFVWDHAHTGKPELGWI